MSQLSLSFDLLEFLEVKVAEFTDLIL